MNRRTFLTSAGVAFAAPMLAGASAAAAAVPNSAVDPAASAWGSDELRKLGIWDIHAHVGTPGPTPAKRMEALVRIADRMGVERLCGKVLGADISVADKKRILRENLRGLLQPALQRKGIKA